MSDYSKPTGGMISPNIHRPTVTQVEDIVDEGIDSADNDLQTVLDNGSIATGLTTAVQIETDTTTSVRSQSGFNTGTVSTNPGSSQMSADGPSGTATFNVGLGTAEFNDSNPGAPGITYGAQISDSNYTDDTLINRGYADGRYLQAVPAPAWAPTAITLGDFFLNGATAALNSGAGNYVIFDPSQDDEITANIALTRNGLSYDATSIDIEIDWMKFGGGVGTVIWEIDYAWISLGDDAYSKVDGTLSATIDVTTIGNQVLVEEIFTVPAGPVGAKNLQLTIRRNGAGGGSDTYGGDAEIYSVNLRN